MGAAGGLEGGVGLLPRAGISRRGPKREGVGTNHRDFAKPLQAFAVPGIEQGVIAPMGREKSSRHGAASSPTSRIFDAWAGKEVAARAATSLWGEAPSGAAKDSVACTARRITALPQDLRKSVLRVFRQRSGKALNHKQVSGALGILNHDVRRAVMALMEELAEKGKLEDLGRGRYVLAASEVQEQSGTEGTIQISRMGTGFVRMPDGNEIRVPKAQTGDAFWGDTVEIEWWQRGDAPRRASSASRSVSASTTW